eukprot:gb/GECG01005508.1/.p1 GENE.gb/GECG01005508.1/~~gb/GECG01005508.1/.p1  ORF type:complete len:595 (+),score=89.96 gb/GECG01005508.1/:1-1785(+)
MSTTPPGDQQLEELPDDEHHSSHNELNFTATAAAAAGRSVLVDAESTGVPSAHNGTEQEDDKMSWASWEDNDGNTNWRDHEMKKSRPKQGIFDDQVADDWEDGDANSRELGTKDHSREEFNFEDEESVSSGGTFDPNIIDIENLGQAPHSDEEDENGYPEDMEGIRRPKVENEEERLRRVKRKQMEMDVNGGDVRGHDQDVYDEDEDAPIAASKTKKKKKKPKKDTPRSSPTRGEAAEAVEEPSVPADYDEGGVDHIPHREEKTVGQRLLGIGLMAASACLFSVMSFIVHISGHGFPTFEVASFRFLVQAVLAFLLLGYYRVPFAGTTGKHKLIFLRCFFGTLGMTCAFWAFTHLPFSDATVIVFTNPVFTAILAALILKERFSWLEASSTFLCLIGIVFISRPSFLFGDEAYNPKTDAYSTKSSETSTLQFAGLAFTASRTFAICMGLFGSISAAFAYLTIRRLGEENTHILVAWFGLVGFLVSTLLGATGQEWKWPTSAGQIFTLLSVGLLGFLGQILMSKGFQIEKAGPAATMRNLDIVLAFIFQTAILNQPPNHFSIVGAVLVTLCALAVAYSKAKKAVELHPINNETRT